MAEQWPKFRTEEERCAFAAGWVQERMAELDSETLEKCGEQRLLRDFQEAILLRLPPVRRSVYSKLG